ncbi:sensor domain-containing diguanylate cyclase [Pseudoalteromonas shioyasakiensis]|uniref:sensor domain-containing diguanylate cyclase n=1 Tax=Pseudoalteromonas shioyasakiensis TaxID=1190813 RepID=UPI001C3C1FDC|nr:diguanylate cyclase [Pseudoalteromonas shioyasakiensis]
MKRLWSLCGVLFVFLFTPYLLANPLIVSSQFKSQHTLNVEYTLDPITQQQAFSNANVKWQANRGETLNLGMTLKPMWLKLSIKNTSLDDVPLILSIDNPLLDEVSVFHLQGGHVLFNTKIGDAVPLANRQIKNESLLASLTIPKASHSEIYLKIKNNGGLRVPLSLWSPSEYLKHKSKFNLLYGLLVGFILSLALTNLVLYGFSRRRYFAYTGLLLTLLWLSLAYLYGYGYRYLQPSGSSFQQLTIPSLFFICGALFVPLQGYIFGFAKSHLNRFQYWLAWAVLLTTVTMWFLPIHIAITLCLLSLPVVLIIFAGIALKQFNREYKQPCIGFLIALFAFFCAIIYSALGVFNPFNLNIGVLSLTFICFLVCSLSLSYAVIKLFLMQRDAEVAAQQNALAESKAKDTLMRERLELQEQARQDLEANIEERTFELQVTLRELEEKNRELEQLNMEDALTKTKNRRYFDKKLLMDIRRSRREQTPLAIIMLDIDHFKVINDTYGHLTGDQTIQSAADVIKQHLKRPLDEVARYGGEEFVVLLPNTPLAGALEIAEQIRKAAQNTDIIVAGTTIKFTLSAGVYSAIAEDINNPSLFTDYADKALYHAKQTGRNRVVSYPLPD